MIILAVVPVPQRKCPFKISLFASHQSIISCFLLSWAIRAMFFCFPMVNVRKSIGILLFLRLFFVCFAGRSYINSMEWNINRLFLPIN